MTMLILFLLGNHGEKGNLDYEPQQEFSVLLGPWKASKL